METIGNVWKHASTLQEVIKRSIGATETEVGDVCVINFEEQGKALYLFMVKRLPKKLAILCKGVEGLNGFEAYRLVSQEADPVLDNIELQLNMEINKLAMMRCKTVAETKRLVEILDEKRQEY